MRVVHNAATVEISVSASAYARRVMRTNFGESMTNLPSEQASERARTQAIRLGLSALAPGYVRFLLRTTVGQHAQSVVVRQRLSLLRQGALGAAYDCRETSNELDTCWTNLSRNILHPRPRLQRTRNHERECKENDKRKSLGGYTLLDFNRHPCARCLSDYKTGSKPRAAR